jgi:hypothetical protein
MIAGFRSTAKALTLAALTFPQLAVADEFTGADVLAWTEAQQDSYFQTSVTMIGIVATQVAGREQIANCIDGWYWKGEGADPEKNASIREAMQRFPETYPQALILAVVEKACGQF